MNKIEFKNELCGRLSGLPQNDIDRSVEFYCEMIDDRVEDGLTEEEAVKQIGSVDEVVMQIMSEIPLSKIVKETVKPKRELSTWEIVLLILGSPIWFSLLIAAVSVIFSVFVTIFSLIIAFYAIDLSLVACGIAGVLGVGGYIAVGNAVGAGYILGAGLICIGSSILLFFVCNQITKGLLFITKKFFLWIKSCFVRKGESQ